MSAFKDKLFMKVFTKMPVFTILFEDTDVEEKFFGVNSDSSIISVTGAGCGIAGHLAKSPQRIDAIDANKHHLALTALKVEAARKLKSHEELYTLFGHGVHPESKKIVAQLSDDLPLWIQDYWKKKHKVFKKGLYSSGFFSKFTIGLHRMGGLDEVWLREFFKLSEEERIKDATEKYTRMVNRPIISSMMNSPLVLLAQGINYLQKERNLKSDDSKNMVGVLLRLVEDLCSTDIEQNWIVWHCNTGKFNHDHPEARPPYLRKRNYEKSFNAKTQVNYHNESFLTVMKKQPGQTWTHYNFSDAMDWMPNQLQKQVFEEILRTSKPNAVLINRTVEKNCLIAKLGLQRHFQRINDVSDQATAMERTKLYKRTDLYRIVK